MGNSIRPHTKHLFLIKGDDNTFANFPDRLRAVVARALPAIKVTTVVYPKYETRGGLKECVGKFREWYVYVEITGLDCSLFICDLAETTLLE